MIRDIIGIVNLLLEIAKNEQKTRKSKTKKELK